MPDFIDVRDLVLSGKVLPKKYSVYIERFGGWFTLQELMGDEKGDVLNNSVNQKSGRVDIKVLYAELFVRSLRYPIADALPPEPYLPPPIDENAPNKEQITYEKAMAKYVQEVEASKHPYTTNHPKAGELVFKPLDRDAANKTLPGEIQEQVAEIAMSLNGMSPADLDQKKVTSNATVIDSTLSPSPRHSDTSTQT